MIRVLARLLSSRRGDALSQGHGRPPQYRNPGLQPRQHLSPVTRVQTQSREDHCLPTISTPADLNYLTGGRNVSDKYFGFGEGRNFNDLDIYVHGDFALSPPATVTSSNFGKVNWSEHVVSGRLIPTPDWTAETARGRKRKTMSARGRSDQASGQPYSTGAGGH